MSSLNVLLGYQHAGNHGHSDFQKRKPYVDGVKCIITSCMNLANPHDDYDLCDHHLYYDYEKKNNQRNGQSMHEYIEMMNNSLGRRLCEKATGIQTCRKCIITTCQERTLKMQEDEFRFFGDRFRCNWLCETHKKEEIKYSPSSLFIMMKNNGDDAKGWMYLSGEDGNYHEYYHRLMYNGNDIILHHFPTWHFDDGKSLYYGQLKYHIFQKYIYIDLKPEYVKKIFDDYLAGTLPKNFNIDDTTEEHFIPHGCSSRFL